MDFWGIPHICIRGFIASFDDVRAYVALNATQQLPVAVSNTPHYDLAHKVISSPLDNGLIESHEAITYMRYLKHQYSWNTNQQLHRVHEYVQLILSIKSDFDSDKLDPWSGNIVCLFQKDFLGIQDGFHRAAVIAALGSRIMPYHLYYRPVKENHIK